MRQRKSIEGDTSAFDTAARGLENMGFREPDVRRALDVLRTKLDASTASVEAIVREALVLLT